MECNLQVIGVAEGEKIEGGHKKNYIHIYIYLYLYIYLYICMYISIYITIEHINYI